MCRGEIDQYFQKNKVPNLDEYLEKSKNKTALLFLCAVKSALLISNYKEHAKEIEDFAMQFGLAFQILNDLNSKEDVKNGIYTLPYVLACVQKNADCDIMELDDKYIREAKEFLDNIILGANQKLMFADNNYKKTLTEIFKNLKDK
jgi:geranylgeranyl pyrophosphate synthase